MTLYPTLDGKRLNDSDLAKLPTKERTHIRTKGKDLVKSLSGLMHKVNESEQVYID